MKFERPSHKYGSIEIAPLVDVVFLLLLFFVLSYNAAGESSFKVLLPPSSEADQKVHNEIVITIQANGEIYLNGSPLPLTELVTELRSIRQFQEEQIVTIRADQRLEVSQLVKVVDATKEAGYLSFGLVTRTND